MDLAKLQARFQRAVVDGDDEVLSEILDSPKESRDVLLGVYRHAYVSRLIEFLLNDYPKLHALLGDEQFGDMARGFIAANPSETPNARWFGQRLPAYLASATQYHESRTLSELASIELSLNDVFDGEDAPQLGLEDLQAVAPDDWPELSFTPHPATRRLDLASNAAELWRALHAGKDAPTPGLAAAISHVLVYRQDGMSSFRVLAEDEAMMWDEMARGVRFSVLCEMLAMHGGEDEAAMRAAGYLQGWIAAGVLAKAGQDGVS